jgi:hypothetical protein
MKGMKTRIKPSEGLFDPWGGAKRVKKCGFTLSVLSGEVNSLCYNLRRCDENT